VAQDHDFELPLTAAPREHANDAAQEPIQQTHQHDAQSEPITSTVVPTESNFFTPQVAGAGFEHTSTTVYRFSEVRQI
jgi:hypothetical protein